MIMLFPVELTLNSTEKGPRLFAYPVKEIEKIYGRVHKWNDIYIQPNDVTLAYVKGDLFDIDVEFDTGNGKQFGFILNDYTVTYDKINKELICGENKAKLFPINGKIRLRILVDRVSTEIFANNGQIYMPMRTLPTEGKKGIQMFSKGGSTKVTSLKVRELNSIWGR
jgi:fructan beta-fructosidase